MSNKLVGGGCVHEKQAERDGGIKWDVCPFCQIHTLTEELARLDDGLAAKAIEAAREWRAQMLDPRATATRIADDARVCQALSDAVAALDGAPRPSPLPSREEVREALADYVSAEVDLARLLDQRGASIGEVRAATVTVQDTLHALLSLIPYRSDR